MTPRHRIGADENGLGPRLGPLVVTAVLADADDRGHELCERPARGAMGSRIGDSKALVAHGDVALGEAWARALCEREQRRAQSVDELVRALCLDDRSELERPCPSASVRAQCWSDEGEAFAAPQALVDDVRRDIDALEKKGLVLRRARSVVVCTKRLNDALAAQESRLVVDLHAMERLVLDHRIHAASDVLAVCGKVGGIGRYERLFGPIAGMPVAVLEESRARSAYRIAGVGEVRFVMDADGSDRLVGIASLVGKYLREVLMARIVRHYRKHDASLEEVSGYHDPRTDRFVRATAARRLVLAVPDACFERARSSAK
jgi:ribonuclease HII